MRQSQFPAYGENDSIYISSFGVERVGEDAFWGPGRRSEGIIHYVLSGEGYFNGHLVRQNQGFYIEPSTLVEYYPSDNDPWNYFWIDCSPEFARKYAYPTLNPDDNGVFDYDFRVKLEKIIDKIISSKDSMGIVESLGYAFSILMLHTPGDTISRTEHYVRKAKNYIDSSLNRKLTVCDVADAISVHDRYLYTLFVQHEGISPKEYILRKKVETAIDLLESTTLSVLEIAAAVGFPDIYSFSKLFKARVGVSPSAYRQALK